MLMILVFLLGNMLYTYIFKAENNIDKFIFRANQATAGPASAVDTRAGLSIPRWPCHPGGRGSLPRPGITCVAFEYEIFSTSICPLPLIHVGQLSVTGTSKGTRYWLFPGKEWLG